jgi:quercetin dioxygenase-like cupin family protein
LERIAGILGVGLKDLFAQSVFHEGAFVRMEERPAISSEWSKGRIEALTFPRPAVPIDGIMVHLEPGGSSGSRLHAALSHRFAFIWKGSVTLSIDDKEYKLKQGDAITLPMGTLHRWHNHSRQPVRIVIVSIRQS